MRSRDVCVFSTAEGKRRASNRPTLRQEIPPQSETEKSRPRTIRATAASAVPHSCVIAHTCVELPGAYI